MSTAEGPHGSQHGGLVLQVTVGGVVLLGDVARVELLSRDGDGTALLRLHDRSGEFAAVAFAGAPLIADDPGGTLLRLGPGDLVRLGAETVLGVRCAPSARAVRMVIRAPRSVRILREKLACGVAAA